MLLSAAFTFGSYGDFASVLSSAAALRRTLAAIAGTSRELGNLICDIDTFMKALQTAKATFDAAIDTPVSVQNALVDALSKCLLILDDARKKTDAYRTQLSREPSSKYHIFKRPCAVLVWEIFGGKVEVERMCSRMKDQVLAINILLLSLGCGTLQRSDTRAKDMTNAIEDLSRKIEKTQRRICELPPRIIYEPVYYFRGDDGKDTLPIAWLSMEDFSELFETLREGYNIRPLEFNTMIASQFSDQQLTTLSSSICDCGISPYWHQAVISFRWFLHPSGSPHRTPAILLSPMSFSVVRRVQGQSVPLEIRLLGDDPLLGQELSIMKDNWTDSWREQRATRTIKPNSKETATLSPTGRYPTSAARVGELGACINWSLKHINVMFEWSFGQPITLHQPTIYKQVHGRLNSEFIWFKQVHGRLGIPLPLVLSCEGNCSMIDALLENAHYDLVERYRLQRSAKFIIHMQGLQRFEYTILMQWPNWTCAELLHCSAYALQQLFKREDRELYCGSVKQDEVILLGCMYLENVTTEEIYPNFSAHKNYV